MTDGRHRPGVDDVPDGVETAGAFRGQRHHPDGAAPGREHLPEFSGVGIAQQRRIVGSAAFASQPRPLQMNPGDQSGPHLFG